MYSKYLEVLLSRRRIIVSILLSDDMDALEAKEQEVLAGITAVTGKRRRRQTNDPTRASESESSRAIMGKATVPQHLQPQTSKINQQKRKNQKSHRRSETTMDTLLVEKAKKNLDFSEESDEDPSHYEGDFSYKHDEIADNQTNEVKACLRKCECQVCFQLKKSGMLY